MGLPVLIINFFSSNESDEKLLSLEIRKVDILVISPVNITEKKAIINGDTPRHRDAPAKNSLEGEINVREASLRCFHFQALFLAINSTRLRLIR